MKTPQELAVARFIKANLHDTASYAPKKFSQGATFTRRDARVEAFEPVREAIEDEMTDDLEQALSRNDTVAYLHVLDRVTEAEKHYMRLYCRRPGVPIGHYYTHDFSYKDREGKGKHLLTTFRVYDSLTLVRPTDPTEFPLH